MRSPLSYIIRTVLVLFLAVSAFGAAPAPAAGGVTLDQKQIHEAYNEGDFEKVTHLIEAYTKANPASSRNDSIFIAKHLAVVYSANPQTREKGRYYMYRLLEMMPSAELVDMFVSDEIDRIFEKVRKEFLARQKGFGVDSSQISMPEKPATGSTAVAGKPAPQAGGPSQEFLAAGKPEESFWDRNGMWVAGGVGLAVAGAVAFFIYTADDTPADRTITIPNQTQSSK